MAMIKCPDCKSPISDSAACCPRCGCNFRPEYEEMQRLRQHIYQMEHDTSARPAEPSGGIGGCGVVSILLLIVAVVVTIYGINLFFEADERITLGLLLAVGGGFAAYLCFMLVLGTIESRSKQNAQRNLAIDSYDQRPARIAEAKRRLAQLEAKFR